VPVLVIVDAVDKFSTSGSSDHLLRWLPDHIPTNSTWVVSANQSEALSLLRGRKQPELVVPPISVRLRRTLLRTFLASYQKKLKPEHEEKIVHDPKSSSPLFLRTLLEE